MWRGSFLRVAAPLLLMVVSGCVYGPEHIPALLREMRAHEARADELASMIRGIEIRYRLPESVLADRIDEEGVDHAQAQTDLAVAETRLEACARELDEIRAVQDWLEQASPDERIRWVRHRDMIMLERERMAAELKQTYLLGAAASH